MSPVWLFIIDLPMYYIDRSAIGFSTTRHPNYIVDIHITICVDFLEKVFFSCRFTVDGRLKQAHFILQIWQLFLVLLLLLSKLYFKFGNRLGQVLDLLIILLDGLVLDGHKFSQC